MKWYTSFLMLCMTLSLPLLGNNDKGGGRKRGRSSEHDEHVSRRPRPTKVSFEEAQAAAARGDIAMVERFWTEGRLDRLPEARIIQMEAIFEAAAEAGQIPVMEYILRQVPLQVMAHRGMWGAARTGALSVLDWLYDRGVEIPRYEGRVRDTRRGILTEALEHDQVRAFEWLIEHGADLGELDPQTGAQLSERVRPVVHRYYALLTRPLDEVIPALISEARNHELRFVLRMRHNQLMIDTIERALNAAIRTGNDEAITLLLYVQRPTLWGRLSPQEQRSMNPERRFEIERTDRFAGVIYEMNRRLMLRRLLNTTRDTDPFRYAMLLLHMPKDLAIYHIISSLREQSSLPIENVMNNIRLMYSIFAGGGFLPERDRERLLHEMRTVVVEMMPRFPDNIIRQAIADRFFTAHELVRYLITHNDTATLNRLTEASIIPYPAFINEIVGSNNLALFRQFMDDHQYEPSHQAAYGEIIRLIAMYRQLNRVNRADILAMLELVLQLDQARGRSADQIMVEHQTLANYLESHLAEDDARGQGDTRRAIINLLRRYERQPALPSPSEYLERLPTMGLGGDLFDLFSSW